MLLFEQVQRERSGVVGLEAGTTLILDAVFLDGELVALGLAGCVQRRELLIEHSEHRLTHVGGYLDRLVVVGDELFDLLDEDRGSGAVVLSGRCTDLPSFYGSLRGALADLEVGINARSLFVAAALLDVPARMQLLGDNGASLLHEAGIGPETGWSCPVAIAVDGVVPGPVVTSPDRQPPVSIANYPGDPSLEEIAAIEAPAWSLQTEPRIALSGIPSTPGTRDERSWAEVFWARTSGRMPLRLHGFSGQRRPTDAEYLADSLAWLGVPGPVPLLNQIATRVTVTVCTQDVEGTPDAIYRVVGNHLLPHANRASVMEELEDGWGYRLAPGNGVSVRRAAAVWVFSVDLETLLEEFGGAAWTLVHHWCGWATQGLVIAAAAHGLYARPALSFDGVAVPLVLGLPPNTTLLIGTVCGHGGFIEPMFDLRT